jgi:hypothetical protein
MLGMYNLWWIIITLESTLAKPDIFIRKILVGFLSVSSIRKFPKLFEMSV